MLRHVLTTVSKTSCWQSALEAILRVRRKREAERVAPTVFLRTNSSHHGFIKHVSHQHCLNLSYHDILTVTHEAHITEKHPSSHTPPVQLFLFSLISNGQAWSDFQILECTIQKFKILCHSEQHDERSCNLTPYPLRGMWASHLLRVSKIYMSPYTTRSQLVSNPLSQLANKSL